MQPELELLRKLHLRGVRIAASCSGSFMLARTGLLDGHRATTSWWLAGAFRQRFPKVQLDADQMLVEDGQLITSGAATAVLTMVLRLIAQSGGEALAQQTSRMLAIDAERQSQAPYVSMALIERPRSSMSEKAEQFLQRELHHEVTVTNLAKHCGTSERSLLRHFRSTYGLSPLAHIQHLRVERAKAMLEATHLSFEEIVERCGYTDVSSFRKLFKRATTLTPVDYRERFRLRR
jgi:transcriptional regulator GlxA family with amidase domain